MSRSKNGFTLNDIDDRENWAAVEVAAWDSVFDFLPNKGELLTDRHHHSALYSTGESIEALVVDSDSLVTLFRGSSGSLDPITGTFFLMENDDDIYLSFMIPASKYAGFYFADGSGENNTMFLKFHSEAGAPCHLSLGYKTTETIILNEAGMVTIGGTNTSGTLAGKLEIYQGNSSADLPVLYLNQAQVSGVFYEVYGTTEAGSSKSLSSWTHDSGTAGYFRIKVNGTVRWVKFVTAPTSE